MKKIKNKLSIILICFLIVGGVGAPSISTLAEATVYITKTGECYHAYAHGRGSFSPTSLSNAQALGLRPCQVCLGGVAPSDSTSDSTSNSTSSSTSDSTSNSTSGSSTSETKEVKKPAKVSSLKETDATSTSIDISWKKTKNTTGYEVYTSTKKNSGFKKVKTISKKSTVKCTFKKASGKKLKANSAYYVKVRAFNKKGSTKKYGKYSTTLKVYTAPGKVSSLKCKKYDSESLTVAWGKTKGASGYTISICEEYDDEVIDSVNTKKLTASFSSLTADNTYCVTVCPFKKVKVAGKSLTLYGPGKDISITLPENEDKDSDDYEDDYDYEDDDY